MNDGFCTGFVKCRERAWLTWGRTALKMLSHSVACRFNFHHLHH
jgi:hypothetical protein